MSHFSSLFYCSLSLFYLLFFFFFFNDTPTTEIYTLSLHDALPISIRFVGTKSAFLLAPGERTRRQGKKPYDLVLRNLERSEEHTSELQSHSDLVCRLLLEKKKKTEHEKNTK